MGTACDVWIGLNCANDTSVRGFSWVKCFRRLDLSAVSMWHVASCNVYWCAVCSFWTRFSAPAHCFRMRATRGKLTATFWLLECRLLRIGFNFDNLPSKLNRVWHIEAIWRVTIACIICNYITQSNCVQCRNLWKIFWEWPAHFFDSAILQCSNWNSPVVHFSTDPSYLLSRCNVQFSNHQVFVLSSGRKTSFHTRIKCQLKLWFRRLKHSWYQLHSQWRTQEFCWGGSTNLVEDRENGDLGAVTP